MPELVTYSIVSYKMGCRHTREGGHCALLYKILDKVLVF